MVVERWGGREMETELKRRIERRTGTKAERNQLKQEMLLLTSGLL